jgi:predicted O-methyltransferase YrrM
MIKPRMGGPLQWVRELVKPRREAGTWSKPVVGALRNEATPASAIGTFVPPGHFYSPLPSADDVDALARHPAVAAPLPGVHLNHDLQLALLEELAPFYPSMPFTPQPTPGLRYRFENPSYSYGDGTLLYAMLRWLRPKRLIEVGSGFTSALTLDTNERFLDNRLECMFIEPYPELLQSLLKEGDHQHVTILPTRLQDVDLSVFDVLEARDVLFIDSTHVAKVNSDVNRLFFEVLPRLAPGTFVHIHDVFAGFEYPLEWLREGRAWNEQYLLRAFMQFNDRFRVRLFGHDIILRHADWFRAHMPLCLNNPGGAFWMEKIG